MKSMDFTIDREKKDYAAHCGHCGKDFKNGAEVLKHINRVIARSKTSVRKRS